MSKEKGAGYRDHTTRIFEDNLIVELEVSISQYRQDLIDALQQIMQQPCAQDATLYSVALGENRSAKAPVQAGAKEVELRLDNGYALTDVVTLDIEKDFPELFAKGGKVEHFELTVKSDETLHALTDLFTAENLIDAAKASELRAMADQMKPCQAA